MVCLLDIVYMWITAITLTPYLITAQCTNIRNAISILNMFGGVNIDIYPGTRVPSCG